MNGQADMGMFRVTKAQRRSGLYISLALHGLLFAWMVYPSVPTYIKPKSVLAGRYGTTAIYLSQAQLNESAVARVSEPMPENSHLTLPNSPRRKKEPAKTKAFARTPQALAMESSLQSSREPAAGTAYGSLSYGQTDGSEVRPAIRVSGSEPAVSSYDLDDAPEGNIIIEVTIDERGNIISKLVLKSFSPAVDHKVLAALEDWRFLPAIRDGIAIPSKQDVYYHFPIRR
jgi:TonB family protein